MEKNQNDVGGESSVQNMEAVENLMDEDDSSALEVITFSRRFPKRIGTFSNRRHAHFFLFSFLIDWASFLMANIFRFLDDKSLILS